MGLETVGGVKDSGYEDFFCKNGLLFFMGQSNCKTFLLTRETNHAHHCPVIMTPQKSCGKESIRNSIQRRVYCQISFLSRNPDLLIKSLCHWVDL